MARWMVPRIAALVSLALAVPIVAAESPVAVSPGDISKVTLIEARCPTFSWAGGEQAKSFELVVYGVAARGEETQVVLRQTVPAPAYSWTPSLEVCLERGGRYAWSIRAGGRKGPLEWSAPRLFEVASGPSVAEFEAALEVVKDYIAVEKEAAESGSTAGESTVAEEPNRPAIRGAPATRAAPAATQISVDGNIDATSFTGDGENLANVATDAELAAHAGNALAHHDPPTTLPPSGMAGGDLLGSFPSPMVANDSHDHGNSTISDALSIDNGRLFAPAGVGRVGIGTTNPASKLHVVGDARVTGRYRFASAKTFYWWLPAPSFERASRKIGSSTDTTAHWDLVDSFGQIYWHPRDASRQVIWAPVQLPNEATVTDIECYFYDTHPSYDIDSLDVELWRRATSSTDNSLVDSTFGGPYPGLNAEDLVPDVVSISGLTTQVFNEISAYTLQVTLDLVTGGSLTFDIGFYGCRVTYTMQSAQF